ncbi:MAG: DUF1499 domain-containing protein [Desulfobulbaceae bacterium]|nr:DUF1499 domain-containing protein [Desulfobulbaceae bacterium]
MKGILPHVLELLMLPCLLFMIVSCTGNPPETQLVDGRLRPCPDKPNCVSSEEQRADAQVAPLAFQGPPAAAWQALKEAVLQTGGEFRQEGDQYLWATFTSKVFRFVDDVEFRMVASENLIQVRSASRLGYSDLGVNRKRVEKLRELFNKEEGK